MAAGGPASCGSLFSFHWLYGNLRPATSSADNQDDAVRAQNLIRAMFRHLEIERRRKRDREPLPVHLERFGRNNTRIGNDVEVASFPTNVFGFPLGPKLLVCVVVL